LTLHFKKLDYLTTAIGSIVTGLVVYSMLSYLLVVPRITIPIAIVISLLTFGLTKYYSTLYVDTDRTQRGNLTLRGDREDYIQDRDHEKENGSLSTILFVTIFGIMIVISSFSLKQDFHIFTNWNDISVFGTVQLATAIMLCFFIPGYGIVLIITKKYKLNPVLAVLLAYLLSILITGLTAYISALSFDIPISETKYLLLEVYLIILVSFVIFNLRHRIKSRFDLQNQYHINHFVSNMLNRLQEFIRIRASELLVFGSLFMLIIVSTYLLYGGVTIGDQWYHQGRALLFMSGSIREAVVSGGEGSYYPPFQSALLAALTTLSGIPLVNSYASIAFLNAIPMFAFYYFFLTWVSTSLRSAALIACCLFTLSSGFGWIYLLTTNTIHPMTSQQSSLDILRNIGSLDIVRTSNFVIPNAPDFSTGLIYIALPAGFVLLGMVRARFDTNFINIFIVTAISVLGLISHHEFYIFVIIGAILPLVFGMKGRNYVYVAFLVAISIVYLIDTMTPGNFLTSAEILGSPLILLAVLFVVITWAIYLTRGYLQKILVPRLILLKTLKKLPHHDSRFNFMTCTLIIFLVAYVYVLSFIVLSQLSLDTIKDHTSQSNIPWYLYPMRLGVVGILGLAFILSYIFKRFEKQVFVFGIIILISLIIGPYYSEGRFSKYVMVGMIGFASLMFYRIVIWKHNIVPGRNVVLTGIIIISSGLSILMFIGYNSLILQNQDYINTLARRHFPSMSELPLFEVLYDKIDIDSEKYSVISFLNEYSRPNDGLMSKISTFAGLPYDKLHQSPLTLNASTLEALYRHLDDSDAGYIILPKHSIAFGKSMTEPTRFAIDYFRRIYEDKSNIILEVPQIEAPTESFEANVGVVYKQGEQSVSSRISDVGLLPYNNKTFNILVKDESVAVQKDNETQGIVLFGSKKENGITLWSKSINRQPGVNYIEVPFRITSEDENKTNDIGVKWHEGDKEYYTKLSKNGIELYQKSMNNQSNIILSKSTEIDKKDWIWYTLKIESLDNSINIYINDALKIQASKALNSNSTEGISEIGVISHHNNVEFKPIKIGSLSAPEKEIHDKTKYYNYYYPVSLLALSKARYDTFRDRDLSVFSKDVIIIPDTFKFDDSTINSYLEYVRAGGTLIAINSDNNFNGTFSRLFSVHSKESKVESFANIAGNKNQNVMLNIPGYVKRFEINSIPDVNLIASYRNINNQTVAPFAMEKIFSNGGRIILVNAEGYFNTISNSPSKFFSSLSNISKLLPLDSDNGTTQNTSNTLQGFIGNMEILGKINLNSSSLSLLEEDSYPYVLNAAQVTIFNKTNDSSISFDNMSIKSLKLIGRSEININLTGMLKLPEMLSDHNYIGTSIPNDFNMTVRLYPERLSYIDILAQNNSVINHIKVNNGSKIDFYNIRAEPPLKSVPVLLKNPEIKVNGRASIKNAYFNGFLDNSGGLHVGDAFNFQGTLKMTFDFIDHYNKALRGGTSTQYITYLQSFYTDGNIEQHEELLKLPGDVHSNTKEKEDIPLEKIFSSSSNIITLIVLSTVTIIGVLLIRMIHPIDIT
jgi:hypothetical protein